MNPQISQTQIGMIFQSQMRLIILFVLIFCLVSCTQTPPTSGPSKWITAPKYPVYTPDGLVIDESPSYKDPQIVEKIVPKLPPEMRGTVNNKDVVLSYIVMSTGEVDGIRVVVSASKELNAIAIGTVARWKFKPATLDGKPISVFQSITITFK